MMLNQGRGIDRTMERDLDTIRIRMSGISNWLRAVMEDLVNQSKIYLELSQI